MNAQERSDEELAREAGGGDEAAFVELYRRYFPRVYDLALRLTRDRETAAAAAQASFYRVHHALLSGETEAPFKSHVFGLAHRDLAERMRHRPSEAQEESDALTDLELVATANLLLIAGHETTTNLIGNGMLALLREPDQLERLRRDESLWPSAIEELLRFDGPVQATVRVPTEDVEIGEQTIAEGSLVLVSIGAANHDPAVFDRPDDLDVGRNPNPHLALGFGAHYCLGANLARLEAEFTLRTLCSRFGKIALENDAPEYRPNPVLRGMSQLEISVA